MPDFLKLVITTFAALFPICNPLGTAVIFLSMTGQEKKSRRSAIAFKSSLFVFLILVAFLCGGTFILEFFGISLAGVRIAGGFVAATIGAQMLFSSEQPQQKQAPDERSEAMEKPDISFSPLAMPLIAGPGSIAVVVTQGSQYHLLSLATLAVVTGILLISLTTWLILSQADRVLRVLGINGANALTKIIALLLLCIGVQLLIEGVQSVLHP